MFDRRCADLRKLSITCSRCAPNQTLKISAVAGASLGVVLGFGRGDRQPDETTSGKRDETPARPITFRAAEDLGPFELAQLWCDRTAWPNR